jgi:septal ring factor EnvC (AmiA/AmiB activator)
LRHAGLDAYDLTALQRKPGLRGAFPAHHPPRQPPQRQFAKGGFMRILFVPFFTLSVSLACGGPVFAASADVQAAVDLVKQSHADQCQKKKIQSQLLVAHQQHDQDKLDALAPELDAINKRLKPTEDKLNTLKASFKKNPDDQTAFETALLDTGDCE